MHPRLVTQGRIVSWGQGSRMSDGSYMSKGNMVLQGGCGIPEGWAEPRCYIWRERNRKGTTGGGTACAKVGCGLKNTQGTGGAVAVKVNAVRLSTQVGLATGGSGELLEGGPRPFRRAC